MPFVARYKQGGLGGRSILVVRLSSCLSIWQAEKNLEYLNNYMTNKYIHFLKPHFSLIIPTFRHYYNIM